MRVPIADENQVEMRPLPSARFRATDDGGGALGGLGEGLQRLGRAGAQFADVQQQIKDQRDNAELKDRDSTLVNELNGFRSRYQAQVGLNADSTRGQFDKDLRKLASDSVASIQSPDLRAYFKPIVERRVASLGVEMDAHRAQQLVVANEQASVARITTAAEEAVATTDPAVRLSAIATGRSEYAKQAEAKGLPAEWVQAQTFRYESGIHRALVEKMLTAERVDDAVAYRDAHKDSINGADEAAIDSMLRVPLQRRDTDQYVDGLMGSATAGDRSSPFSYADPLHGLGRAPVAGGKFNAARDYGGHQGIDMPAAMGTPVFASAPGVVRLSVSAKGGNIATIEHGEGGVPRYMHLGAFAVKDGERVTPDTRIGAVGMTGRTSGPHLHYEVRENGKPINPDHAIAAVQQAPQRHDLARLLSNIDRDTSLTPEQRDRYKAETERRVGRDEQLLSRQQDDAKNAIYAVIDRLGGKFTSVAQLPPGLLRNLSPEALHSLTTTARQNAAPKAVEANGNEIVNLHQLAYLDPEGFKKRDLRQSRPFMTAAEYDQVSTLQASMLGKVSAPAEVSHSRIWSQINFLGRDIGVDMSAKRKGEADDAFTARRADGMALFSVTNNYLRTLTEGKRQPTDDEIKRAFDNAVMPRANAEGMVAQRYRDPTAPRNSVAMPRAIHDSIAARLRARGLPFDDQTVARVYMQGK